MEKLLFTGSSGFLGRNIMPLLKQKYDVTSCSIDVNDKITVDLAKCEPNLPEQYDIVLHACGKAHHIPKSSTEAQSFYEVNYKGTVNICRALERVGVPKAFIFISTVAVYGCEFGLDITENHPLKGVSPYAKSKIQAEEYLKMWCDYNNVTLSILRPSLLVGKNAVGNLGSMIKSIKNGYYVNVAKGNAVKSVLMADDIARVLPMVAYKGGIYNLCDTRQLSFSQLSELIAYQLGKHSPYNVPYLLVWFMAKVGDFIGRKSPINSCRLEKITKSLTFSNAKARRELGWEPLDVLENYRIT